MFGEEVGGKVDRGIGEGMAGRVGDRVDDRNEGEGVERVNADDRQREEASDKAITCLYACREEKGEMMWRKEWG